MTEVLLYLLNNKKCETQKKSTNAICRECFLHLEELRGNSWKKRKYQKLEINITK